MKKGLLRTLSAVVAISMLLCMSMVAFADSQAYNVTTTYDGTNVTVTTEVTGAAPSEQVAFLVEKGENIIWIDQQPANTSGAASSVFTDAAADAVGATVKVGTSSLAASTFGNEKTIALPEYKITWKVEGSDDAVVKAVVGESEVESGAKTSRKVTFYVAAPANVKLLTVNGVTPTIVGDAISYDVSADTEFVFVFAAKEVAATTPGVAANPVVVKPSAEDEEKTASVTATATEATDFGILVALEGGFNGVTLTKNDVSQLGVDTTPIRKYHAMGANAAGQFVIQLQDTGKVFFVDDVKYEARVYAVGSDLVLGEVFALN